MKTGMFDKASDDLQIMDDAMSEDSFALAERKARLRVELAKAEAINNLAEEISKGVRFKPIVRPYEPPSLAEQLAKRTIDNFKD